MNTPIFSQHACKEIPLVSHIYGYMCAADHCLHFRPPPSPFLPAIYEHWKIFWELSDISYSLFPFAGGVLKYI